MLQQQLLCDAAHPCSAVERHERAAARLGLGQRAAQRLAQKCAAVADVGGGEVPEAAQHAVVARGLLVPVVDWGRRRIEEWNAR